ncbi:MAG: RNA polymerase subunit sigma-70 [Robiginitomaculum sp.]|nr:MAG: RNA polymerase subunit sigma-70 [Robiginitomaculum sp.]
MLPNREHNHAQLCAALVKTHQGQIRAFLRRLTRNSALADDLAQDTFLRAFQSMGQVKDDTKTKSWLFQIAYRIFLDHIRKHKRRQELADANMPPDDGTFSSPSGMKMDIEQAMNSLTPEQRAAVMLCLSYGFSHSEAAKALNQPLGTVKSHVARGKDKLRAFLCVYEKA